MANYADLKAAVAAVIKQNGSNEITGEVLKSTLLSIIDTLGKYPGYMGLAVPGTVPGTPDQNIFYFATTPGVYVNYGGLVIPDSGLYLIRNNDVGQWISEKLLNPVENKIVRWEAKPYVGALDQVLGSDNALYELRPGQSATPTDVPFKESNVWQPRLDLFADYAKYWGNDSYVNKLYGNRDDSVSGAASYRSTFFMKLIDRNGLIITGFSGDSNNAALVAFYDAELNFLGSYNVTGVTDTVTLHTVPPSQIPSKTFYVKATRRAAQKGVILGVSIDSTMISTPNDDVSKSFIYTGLGHINKNTGDVDKSSGQNYQHSKFLKILDRSNIVVSGFSGATNTVALVAFYDVDFKYISSYNTATQGDVTNHKIPVESVPVNAVYVVTTKRAALAGGINGVDFKYLISPFEANKLIDRKLAGTVAGLTSRGFIKKSDGQVDRNAAYLFSTLYTITDRNNLIIKAGFSGATNNVALVAFYDVFMNYVGHYNTAQNAAVTNVTVPETSIPASAIYIKVSLSFNQRDSFGVSGAERTFVNSAETDLSTKATIENAFTIDPTQAFNDIGYIDKTNGTLNTTGTTYRATPFLRISDKNNLRVSGFSGANNNAALAGFYDKDFNFLGFYNTDTQGDVFDYLIPAGAVPLSAIYVRFSRRSAISGAYSGVSGYFDILSLLRYIDGKKTVIPDIDVRSERSGKPNPDRGGHMKLINYLGNDQNIHPKVIYFNEPWNGYYFWMAYTPYPGGSTIHENPCIAASNPGENFETPPGLVNPLEYAPQNEINPRGYNSDTHLVYNPTTNKIECWWRSYNPDTVQDCIKRRVSADGINFEPTEIIFDFGDHVGSILSPSIIFEDGLYKLWYCSGGMIKYTESETAGMGSWSEHVTLPIPFGTYGLNAWHMDVIHTGKGYEFAVQCWRVPGGTNNTSDLYYILQTGSTYSEPQLIVERGDRWGDLDYMGIYRASILYVDGIYSIYYSAIAANFSHRAIFLTKGRGVDRLRGVNL